MEDLNWNQSLLDKALQKTACMDGFVLVSRNLNFYSKPIGSVHVQLPFLVFSSPSKRFKSCKVLNRFSFTHSIKVASLLQSDLLVVFPSDVRVINYSRLLSLVTQCLEKTLDSLKNTKTKSAWSSSLLKHHHHRNDIIVFTEDIQSFGKIFWRYLNELLSTFDELSDVYIVLFGMGQSFPIEFGRNLMYHINTSEAEEIVIHIAYDVALKSHALMWNRESVEKLKFGKISYEYYPLAIAAAGNFYIPIPESPVLEIGPKVRMVKLYSEAFKYVHKEIKCNPPFKQASIAGSLFKAMLNPKRPSMADQNSVDMMKNQCNIVRAASVDILQKPEISVRAELIISTIQPSTSCFENSLVSALNFIQVHELICAKNLLIFELEVIHQRIEDYVYPCLQTIENSINRRICSLFLDTYTIDYYEFSSVAASECVLCFLLYGSSFSTRTERRHSNELAQELNCNPRLYNKRSEATFPNLTLDIFSGSVVHAFRSDKILDSVLGYTCKEWYGLNICKFLEILQKRESNVVNLKPLCKTIAKAIFTSSFGGENTSAQPLKHTHNLLLRYPRHRFVTSKIFVSELRAMKNWDNKKVRNFIRFIQNATEGSASDVEFREILFSEIMDGIENVLWEEMEYAVYPTRVGFSIIVVPIMHLPQYVQTVFFNPYVELLFRVYSKFGKGLLQVGGAKVAIKELLVQVAKSEQIRNVRVVQLLNTAQKMIVGQSFHIDDVFKN